MVLKVWSLVQQPWHLGTSWDAKFRPHSRPTYSEIGGKGAAICVLTNTPHYKVWVPLHWRNMAGSWRSPLLFQRGEVYLRDEPGEGTSCLQLILFLVPVVRSAVCNEGAFLSAFFVSCKLWESESSVVFQRHLWRDGKLPNQGQNVNRPFAYKLKASSSYKLIFITMQHFDHRWPVCCVLFLNLFWSWVGKKGIFYGAAMLHSTEISRDIALEIVHCSSPHYFLAP